MLKNKGEYFYNLFVNTIVYNNKKILSNPNSYQNDNK